MKFPNNIVMDVSKNKIFFSNQYWIFKYLLNFKKELFTFNSFTSHKSFLTQKENLLLNKLIKNEKKFTINYKNKNTDEINFFLKKNKEDIFVRLFKLKNKVKNKEMYSDKINKKIYNFFNKKTTFNENLLKKIITNFSFKKKNSYPTDVLNIFDINFLRKEKIYTKLKYSRVPQYDIVSGGVAAIFAGFLGFLICEKFGFELLDSGDFYFLFMYLVFLFFFCRLFIKLLNKDNFSWNIFSFKWALCFYKICFNLFIKFLMK